MSGHKRVPGISSGAPGRSCTGRPPPALLHRRRSPCATAISFVMVGPRPGTQRCPRASSHSPMPCWVAVTLMNDRHRFPRSPQWRSKPFGVKGGGGGPVPPHCSQWHVMAYWGGRSAPSPGASTRRNVPGTVLHVTATSVVRVERSEAGSGEVAGASTSEGTSAAGFARWAVLEVEPARTAAFPRGPGSCVGAADVEGAAPPLLATCSWEEAREAPLLAICSWEEARVVLRGAGGLRSRPDGSTAPERPCCCSHSPRGNPEEATFRDLRH